MRRLRRAMIGCVLACPALTWPAGSASAAEPAQDAEFVADDDGSIQHYAVILPDRFDPAAAHDLLLVLHGHGSDRWQYIRSERDECRVARDVAAARRMILVAPDYRAKTSWMGPKAEADVLQMLDKLKADYRIGKTVLCGGSMGGASALTFAAIHPRLVDGLVAMNGTANHLEYENFQEAIRQSFGGGKAEIPLQYKRRSAEYWPERLTMPIALTSGGKDHSVPPDSVIRLAAVLNKLQPNVLLIHRPEGGHATSYEDGKAALEFVLARIR
ncbi:MAG: alpha/beta fold hydrolase [Pirellulales bacterium]|jgi:pimeloyl-ACP methyl ester carboxylesterase|nr:alpha/beta fold hydrolase [Thermoguttaceae bacterium]MDD4789002.1 alpha/beta fold hydrolase [Pirellulales bacterium]MDI9442740.1 alpha/beta fold hydrolase [Planctomycetota bacterium]NLY99660.1 alpha/beta fold hydrolase [Pirellulaceae bacterium]